MNKHSDLIGQLSNKSKANSSLRESNNPLIRKNKQLEEENQTLLTENEELRKEITSLKLSLADVVNNDDSEINDKVTALNKKVKQLKADLIDKDSIIDSMKSTVESPSETSFEEFLSLDLSANGQKFLLAISKLCLTKDTWYHISGRSIKRDFNVHDNYFTDAREELISKDLIEVKEEKRGKQPLWKYKRLF